MAAKKSCPSCKKEINATTIKCPHCQKELQVLCWEIELESGDKVVYSGERAEASIREDLISGKLKLANRCRQYTSSLERVEAGTHHYDLKVDMGWKTLREYANGAFSLQALYDPVKAYGKRSAQITWAIVGVIVAIGWNMNLLLAVGANPLIAFVMSAVLIPLTITIVGLAIGSLAVATIYGLPAMGMATRTLVAIVIGALVGGVVGWTLGYVIGVCIGLTKKKILETEAATAYSL